MSCGLAATRWLVTSFGSNSSGQLGTADLEDHSSPQPCSFASTETLTVGSPTTAAPILVPACLLQRANSVPPLVASGGNHSFLYWEDLPLLYGCGSTLNGELGCVDGVPSSCFSDAEKRDMIFRWALLPLPLSNLKSETSACSHTTQPAMPIAVATKEHIDYTCSYRNVDNIKIKRIAVGWNHTVLLSTCGGVYVTGSNAFGQCGVSSDPIKNVLGWKEVDFGHSNNLPASSHHLTHISHIACGLRHSIAVSVSGCVFGWGSNSKNQLGLPTNISKHYSIANVGPTKSTSKGRLKTKNTNIVVPTLILLPLAHSEILEVSCGRYHTAYLTANKSPGSNTHTHLQISGKSRIFRHLSSFEATTKTITPNSNWVHVNISSFFASNAYNSTQKVMLDVPKLAALNHLRFNIVSSWDNIFIYAKTSNASIKFSDTDTTDSFSSWFSKVFGFGSNSFKILGEYFTSINSPTSEHDKSAELVVEPNLCIIQPFSNLKSPETTSVGIEDSVDNNGSIDDRSHHFEIDQLCVGSYHAVAKSRTNKVVCWGWNEHGNCGLASEPKKLVGPGSGIDPGPMLPQNQTCWPPNSISFDNLKTSNVCSLNPKVALVACGYGNTFVVLQSS